jgi:hypothetical protein
MMTASSTVQKTNLPLPTILPEVLLRGGLPRQAILVKLQWDELLEALEVNLSPFERFFNADLLAYVGNPIMRPLALGGLGMKIIKAMAKKALKLPPEPLLLIQDLSETEANVACPNPNRLSFQDFQRVYASFGDSLHTLTYRGLEHSSYQTAETLISLIETAYACTPVEHLVVEVVSLPTEMLLTVSLAILKRCPSLRLTWRFQLQGFAPHHNEEIRNQHPQSTEQINPWQQTITAIFALRTLRKTQKQSLGASIRLGIEVETTCTPTNEGFLNQWYGFVLGVLCPDDWKLSLASTPINPNAEKAKGLKPYEATFIALAQQWEADWLETGTWQALQPEERHKYAVGWEQAHWVLAISSLRKKLEAKALSGVDNSPVAQCEAGVSGGYFNTVGILGGCEAFVKANNEATSTLSGYGAVQLANFNALAVWQGSQANLMRQLSGCASLCGQCQSSQQQLLPTQWLSLTSWYQAWHIQQALMGNTQQHQNLQAALPEFVGHA